MSSKLDMPGSVLALAAGVHGDELRRGGHEEPFALYYKHKRMCNCDCKAQRRLQGTGLWEASSPPPSSPKSE